MVLFTAIEIYADLSKIVTMHISSKWSFVAKECAKVLDVSWRYNSSVSRSFGTRSTLISVTGDGTETAFGWLLDHLSGLTTLARFCCVSFI